MTPSEIAHLLQGKFSESVTSVVEFRGESTVHTTKGAARTLLKYCKDELDFDMVLDISSVDNMGQDPRFEMIYELYSLSGKVHLRVKCPVSEDDTEVPTVSDIWPTADWHEREVYDMMGITFANHPDLRRILMWDGYPFFPLRKEFPLEGKPSDMPDVAFTNVAPLAGGPFVTCSGEGDTVSREPRARS